MADAKKTESKKIDPFDVEALEKSLNDSATRVSTIWISYLLFGLYLVVAAGTVKHRQLFLEDPIKLPVLNTDLPLVGFFFLTPALFVILHIYLLLQIVMLGRTAVVYNESVDRLFGNEAYNTRIRQRLANTLFAQIFSGSPRERDGLFGLILISISWITLVIAPVLVLLVAQERFLPYHDHFVTWTHRLLIALDLAALITLWPSTFDARVEPSRKVLLLRRLVGSTAVVIILFSSIALSFPGEVHAGWTRFSTSDRSARYWKLRECQTVSIFESLLGANFDRLVLPGEDFVDDEKLSKIETAAKARSQPLWVGERTRTLRGRDLGCGRFGGTDLRFADFSEVIANGANFISADLQGINLTGAQIPGGILSRVRLEGANLAEANLQNADLRGANLSYALFAGAQLKGVDLREASLVGAQQINEALEDARRQ